MSSLRFDSYEEIPYPHHFSEETHFNVVWLRFGRFIPLLSWRKAWWHTGRHGPEEVAWNFMPGSAGSKKRVTLKMAWASETPQSTPSNRLPPTRPQILIFSIYCFTSELMWAIFIQSTTVYCSTILYS